MDIAKRIKTLREEHGLTQEQLAKELSISRNAISNYENGVRRPDLDLVTKMCDIFNVTLDSFFKEELVYRKPPKTGLIRLILQISLLVMLIVTCVLSIILFDKSFSHIKAVDDKTKVENSNEIAIINITNKIDKKTYEVEIIDKLKGDAFSYIIIKDRDIEINISSNYLIFGNRLAKDSQYKNYVSYDVIEIYSLQYLQELSGDALSHPTVNYYKELIDTQPKPNVLIANLINPRKEEYVISSKNLYENPYDSFDLNEDFDVKFRDAYYSDYKYVDVKIDVTLSINNVNKCFYLYRDKKSSYSNLEEYEISINNKNEKICLHFINVDINYFRIDENSNLLFISYSYDSLLKSSWVNSKIKISIVYRK